MRNIILVVLFIGFTSIAYAGGVTDTNNGNTGDIFVSTGVNNGANSVGQWLNPSSVPSLKGAKGDTGATGAQGIQGLKGDTGATGAQGIQGVKGNTGSQGIQGVAGAVGATGAKGDQGIQGVAGTNGVDGKDGLNGSNGVDGKDGAKGDKGDAGTNGIDGKDGEKGDKGDVGATGNTGETGANGKDVDPAIVDAQNAKIQNQSDKINNLNKRVGKLEDTQYIVGAEVRLYDSRKWTITSFVDFTATRNTVDRAGVRLTYKIGRSYEEERLDVLEAKLKTLEGTPSDKAEVYTDGGSVGIRTRF